VYCGTHQEGIAKSANLNLKEENQMNIKLRTYRRKDGFVMIYANNDRGVSVGIAEGGLPGMYSKTRYGSTSQGQRNLMEELPDYFERLERDGRVVTIDGNPDFEVHAEDKSRLGTFGDLYITDVAEVGGVKVGSDGAYLYRAGKLYAIDED